MKISKFALLNAFANGLAFLELGFTVINRIEREDGSNNNYNVTGLNQQGETMVKFIKCQ